MEERKVPKIRKKIQIRVKETYGIPFSGRMKVKLIWDTEADQDLCIFYKSKEGVEGGVFSNEYRNKMSDLGFLDKFPYILHKGDEKEPEEGEVSSEQVNIAKFDEIDTAYVCIVNYSAALKGSDTSFREYKARIEVQSEDGSVALQVNADSSDTGCVFLVCTIQNKDGKNYLTNENTVMSLSDAYYDIPGFKLITK